MQAWVFFYSMKGLEAKIRGQVLNQLLGKYQQSNYGRYHYQVNGKIPKNAYIKPVRAALIVKKRYVQLVCKLFDSHHISYRYYEITLDPSEFEKKVIF